jgi:hypothetical protein
MAAKVATAPACNREGAADDPPFYVFPDVRDPDFSAQCAIWRAQNRSEISELVGLTWKSIDESRTLIAEADRLLVLQGFKL